MPQSKETQDPTAERLLALNVQLTQVLCEAGIVRVRVQKACEANVWPTVPSFMFNDRPVSRWLSALAKIIPPAVLPHPRQNDVSANDLNS
jgi:hypothetical protein